jgi:hypothetical protein
MAKKSKPTLKARESKCECGKLLPWVISPYVMPEQRGCPKCGRIHYVDTAPIDWDKITHRKDKEKQ